jgi:hypothetical protein
VVPEGQFPVDPTDYPLERVPPKGLEALASAWVAVRRSEPALIASTLGTLQA